MEAIKDKIICGLCLTFLIAFCMGYLCGIDAEGRRAVRTIETFCK